MDYWLVETGAADQPGINGGITRRMAEATTVNTVDVPDVDEYVRKVEAAGGKVVMPKGKVPGVGDLAYCSDTEGNVFGIIQPEPM